MIFGLTTAERWRRRYDREDAKDKRERTGIVKFALFPIELTDGRIVWLENYILKKEVNSGSWFDKRAGLERYWSSTTWHRLACSGDKS